MTDMMTNATKVCEMITKAGFKAFFVGGCVRDMLMGNAVPHDIDITTDATPDEIHAIFPKHIDTGLQHGTVTVNPTTDPSVEGVNLFEVTTFRIDGDYTDGRHPDEVIFVKDVKDDLARRDLTINAIALDPIIGEIVDPFGGLADINAGIVKAVGVAKDRFMEDPLRVLRAMRFAIKFGFDIDPDTAEAMKDREVLDRLATSISKERITAELEKMLTCGKPIVNTFMAMTDVIVAIFPDMAPMITAKHNNPWHRHDIFEHTLFVVDACETTDFAIKLAALFHDIGKPATSTLGADGFNHFTGHPGVGAEMCETIFTRDLRLKTDVKERAILLVKIHDDMTPIKDKDIMKKITTLGIDVVRDWIIIKKADIFDHAMPAHKLPVAIKNRVAFMDFVDRLDDVFAGMSALSIKDLAIDGHDVMALLGIAKPDKRIGTILKATFDAVIDDGLANDKDVLLDFAKTLI